jgi:hypothetical protein
VFLARLDVDDVAGADLSSRAAASCDQSDAVCDVQGLALGWWCQAVRAPGENRTWAQPRADCSSGLRMPSICTVPVNWASGPGTVRPLLWVYFMVWLLVVVAAETADVHVEVRLVPVVQDGLLDPTVVGWRGRPCARLAGACGEDDGKDER